MWCCNANPNNIQIPIREKSSSHLNIKLNILWGYSIILVKDTFCPPPKGTINFIIGPFFKQDIRHIQYTSNIYLLYAQESLFNKKLLFYSLHWGTSKYLTTGLDRTELKWTELNRHRQTGRALQLQIPRLSHWFSSFFFGMFMFIRVSQVGLSNLEDRGHNRCDDIVHKGWPLWSVSI